MSFGSGTSFAARKRHRGLAFCDHMLSAIVWYLGILLETWLRTFHAGAPVSIVLLEDALLLATTAIIVEMLHTHSG